MQGEKRIRLQVKRGTHLLEQMLSHMERLFAYGTAEGAEKSGESSRAEAIYGDKDSLLSAYLKLSQLQMKWVEIDMALEKESARQREQREKIAAATKAETTKPAELDKPLSEAEWAILSQALLRQESAPAKEALPQEKLRSSQTQKAAGQKPKVVIQSAKQSAKAAYTSKS